MTKPTSDMVARMLGADRAVEVSTVEDMCARIKAADDAAADKDYMLDSNDCIAVLRGTWEGPLANDCPPRPEAPDLTPPATSRDKWMYRQGWLAALDPRSHGSAALNRDQSVAVSPTHTYNEDMTQAPRGVKLILLGQGGVAQLSEYNGDAFWIGWAALPRRAGGDV